MKFKKSKILKYSVFLAVFVGSVSFFSSYQHQDDDPFDPDAEFQNSVDELREQQALEEERPASYSITEYEVKRNSTVYSTLREAHIDPAVIHRIVEAAKDYIDLAQVKAKTKINLLHTEDTTSESGFTLHALQFKLNKTETLVIERNEDKTQWTSRLDKVEVKSEVVTFKGSVDSSLWMSAKQADMEPQLVIKLADVFAWQIDFSREVRKGDRWRFAVRKLMAGDQFVGWGRIVAAEYINNGRVFSAVNYVDEAGKSSYYEPNGDSLRKLFLKSPVSFSRITSRFQRRRFHPVLKVNRPHNGVDYGAAPGTPVKSVGDGVVVERKYGKISGNMVKIRHNSKYSTSYHHLKGFAKGLRKGSRVHQGDVIGYVGATGRVTGPHLHFAFYENGRFVDPLGIKFPSADPVGSTELGKFKKHAQSSLAMLPKWSEKEMEEERSNIAVH